MARHTFQTEVNQLLQLMIHSLYSNKEIFLRELISNASDAIDKLKYLTLTEESYKSVQFDPRIEISFDEKDRKQLIISDSGIGMNEEDLVENLGTIARSGTRSFVERLSGDFKKDSNLIGQFGVGFYSSFMVADHIEVITRKAGEEKAHKWVSEGKGEYEISEASRDSHGTTIILNLSEDGKTYASRWEIESIVKKYSNHIPFPIFLHHEEKQYDDEGKEKGTEAKISQINSASALWKKSKSELKEEDYQEFYKTLSHDSDDPLLYVHTHAEGTLEYTTLFYIPKKAPFDMFRVDYQPGVKLYVKRVFITDDEKELLPSYLRFVRGVIDSEDLPLNVSREILQQNRILASIRSASVKKILAELQKLAESPDKYRDFYEEFGRPLKEGLYQDTSNRDTLLELVRFKSSIVDGYTSLADYQSRMKSDQKAIYYIAGEKEIVLRNSPLLEPFKTKGIDVLIMDDEVDEIVIPAVGKYKDMEFKSLNRSDATADLKTDADKESEKAAEPILAKIKKALGDDVKDVRASAMLSDSPACIVADENDPTIQMQHMLKAMGQTNLPESKPILEVNPNHQIIKSLENVEDEATIEDVSRLLLEQSLLLEGMELKDPAAFTKRMNRFLSRSLLV